jgi:hypothetical protein
MHIYSIHSYLSYQPLTEGGCVLLPEAPLYVMIICIEYIGVVSVYIQYNCVYYCDTYLYPSSLRRTPQSAKPPTHKRHLWERPLKAYRGAWPSALYKSVS